MVDYEYLTSDFISRTRYPSIIKDAEYDRFSLVRYRNSIQIVDRGLSDRSRKLIIKEIRRIYPDLIYVEV